MDLGPCLLLLRVLHDTPKVLGRLYNFMSLRISFLKWGQLLPAPLCTGRREAEAETLDIELGTQAAGPPHREFIGFLNFTVILNSF